MKYFLLREDLLHQDVHSLHQLAQCYIIKPTISIENKKQIVKPLTWKQGRISHHNQDQIQVQGYSQP